jgi:hypothetical protein
VHYVSDVRQIEIQTAEPLVSRTRTTSPSHLEVEIAIATLKKYKSPGSDQILAELIQAGGKMFVFAIHKLINCTWNRKNSLIIDWKESVVIPIHKRSDKPDIVIVGYH